MEVYVVISYIFYPHSSGEVFVNGVFSSYELAQECFKSLDDEWDAQFVRMKLDKMP